MVYPAKATSNISEVQNIDLILICVKTWQLNEVINIIKNVLTKEIMIISLLNGVDDEEVLSTKISKKHIIGALCKIVSKIENHGIINHISYEPTIVFWELDNKKYKRSLELKQIFEKAGITTKSAMDIQKEIWIKILFISTISATGALTSASIGEMICYPKNKGVNV
ncbi:ketopantoate reductase family protein [Lutibacter sp.]